MVSGHHSYGWSPSRVHLRLRKDKEGYLLAISVGTWNCVKRERLGTCLEETRWPRKNQAFLWILPVKSSAQYSSHGYGKRLRNAPQAHLRTWFCSWTTASFGLRYNAVVGKYSFKQRNWLCLRNRADKVKEPSWQKRRFSKEEGEPESFVLLRPKSPAWSLFQTEKCFIIFFGAPSQVCTFCKSSKLNRKGRKMQDQGARPRVQDQGSA